MVATQGVLTVLPVFEGSISRVVPTVRQLFRRVHTPDIGKNSFLAAFGNESAASFSLLQFGKYSVIHLRNWWYLRSFQGRGVTRLLLVDAAAAIAGRSNGRSQCPTAHSDLRAVVPRLRPIAEHHAPRGRGVHAVFRVGLALHLLALRCFRRGVVRWYRSGN